MTDNEVVEAAERMARKLLELDGFRTSEPSIRRSKNPRAVRAWAQTKALLEAYNGTDLQSAEDTVDEEVA